MDFPIWISQMWIEHEASNLFSKFAALKVTKRSLLVSMTFSYHQVSISFFALGGIPTNLQVTLCFFVVKKKSDQRKKLGVGKAYEPPVQT